MRISDWSSDVCSSDLVVLGNHEQYMLRANPSRANAEHLHALNAMGGYRHAFAADTMIGEWLRQPPVALKLGSVLFVHGGVSPPVARTGLTLEQTNAAMPDYWHDNAPHPHSPKSEQRRVGEEGGRKCH